MLELRPTCENCNTALPAHATEATICSYECTFCRSCVEQVLHNVCPNCGGGLWARPIRPSQDRSGGNYLGTDPASTQVKHRPVDRVAHAAFVASLLGVPPEQR